MDAAVHEGMGEQRGGMAKRHRADATEPAVRMAGELSAAHFQHDRLAAIHAAAAAGGSPVHDDPMRATSGAMAAQRESLEGQSMILRNPAGLVDIDRVQIDIAALDSRLMSRVLLEVLTPWQAACFLTEAFPYLPDRQGLADLVRADLKFKRSLGQ